MIKQSKLRCNKSTIKRLIKRGMTRDATVLLINSLEPDKLTQLVNYISPEASNKLTFYKIDEVTRYASLFLATRKVINLQHAFRMSKVSDEAVIEMFLT